MKIRSRSIRLATSLLWSAVALAFSASTFADSSKDGAVAAKQSRIAQKAPQKIYYITVGSSGIPQPCDRLTPVPTTAGPMDIIGELPIVCTGRPAH